MNLIERPELLIGENDFPEETWKPVPLDLNFVTLWRKLQERNLPRKAVQWRNNHQEWRLRPEMEQRLRPDPDD